MSLSFLWCISNTTQVKQSPPAHLVEWKGEYIMQAHLRKELLIIQEGPTRQGSHIWQKLHDCLETFIVLQCSKQQLELN